MRFEPSGGWGGFDVFSLSLAHGEDSSRTDKKKKDSGIAVEIEEQI